MLFLIFSGDMRTLRAKLIEIDRDRKQIGPAFKRSSTPKDCAGSFRDDRGAVDMFAFLHDD